MPFRLLPGRAGSGKSTLILRKIAEECRKDPFGPPLILLVPEQASYQAEKALLTEAGLNGYTRAQVLSFRRLPNLVYTNNAAPVGRRLGARQRQLIVMLALAKLRAQRPGTFLDSPGIEESLDQWIAEIRQQGTTLDELAAALAAIRERVEKGQASIGDRLLGEKLAMLLDFAMIYEEVEAGRFIDPAAELQGLADVIRRSPTLVGAAVYIDGFTDFSPNEELLVAAMALRAASVTMAVTLPPALASLVLKGGRSRDPIFRSVEEGLARLVDVLRRHGVDVVSDSETDVSPLPRFRASGLAVVERAFLRGRSVVEPDASGVTMLVADSPRDEARLAAETVANMLRENPTWSPAQIAIAARDLTPIAASLERHFGELKIPAFVDLAVPLETHPIVSAIRAMTTALLHPGAAEPFLELAKSGLAGMTRDESDFLEMHLRQYPRSREEWLSERPWQAPASRDFGDEEDEQSFDLFSPLVENSRSKLVGIYRNLSATVRVDEEGRIPFGDLIASLIQQLQLMVPYDDLPESERRVLRRIGELLAEAHDVLGDERLPLAMAVEVVQRSLSGLELPRIPPLLDQVYIGQADRSRFPPVKAMIVIGLVEGEFPRPVANRSILNDGERIALAELSVSLRPDSKRLFERESFHAYRVLTLPSERLVLTRSVGSNDGKPLEPSPYWTELERILAAKPRPAESLLQPARCWRPRELVAAAARLGDQSHLTATNSLIRSSLLLPPTVDLIESRETMRVKVAALWKNTPRLDPARVRQVTEGRLRLNATALDSLGACGFQHFVRHVLRPKQMVEPRFAPMDAGNYAHRVLENFSASIRELPDLPGPDDYSTVRSLFAAACRTPRERMEAAGLLSDPAGQMLHDRMDEVLESLCFWLVETWRLYNLRPVAEEVPFQFSIPVRDPAGSDWTLVLAGKIDRIDETIGSGSANPSRCVVDYKLSRKKFDFGRWFTGENSQLPIYLLAARDSGGAESVSAGFYLEIITAGDDAKRRYSGLAGREVLLRMLTPCGESITRPSHIEGTATDPANGIGKWGSAVLDSDLELILDHTRRMIEEAVGRIAAADIAIEPSRIGDNTACAWCGFKSVCQHDFTVNGVRRKPALGRIDVISQLRAGIQTEKGAGG